LHGEAARVVRQQEKAAVSQASTSSPWLPTTPLAGALFGFLSRRFRQTDFWGTAQTVARYKPENNRSGRGCTVGLVLSLLVLAVCS